MAARSRSSGRTRRSSSAARASASSGWQPGRATSCGLDLRQNGEAILDAFEARTEVRIGSIRDEVGDRLAGLDINVLRAVGNLAVTDQPLKVAADVARDLAARTGVEIGARDVLESPFSLIGSVPELVDKLRSLRQRWGINSFLVGWFDEPTIRDIAPVIEQLADA